MNELSVLETLIETRGVHGAYEVGSDGFLLDSVSAGPTDPEQVAAVSAVCAVTSERMGNGLSLGNLQWILLEFKKGKMVVARHGNTILVVVGNKHLVFGDVLNKIKTINHN